jgi:divalent metal cation (Fe/Co/Zn/Cd) transporter
LHIVVDPGLSVEEGHAIGESVKRALLDSGPEVHDVLVKIEPDSGHSGGEWTAVADSPD